LKAKSQRGTVVVAGGAGFIGSHMCERLLDESYAVVCVDNLLTGRRSNIDHLSNRPGFEYRQADLTTSADLIPDDPSMRVTHVMNLASPASPVHYGKHPIETLKVGAVGTMNALEFASRKGAVFLQASTSEVYGDPLVNPQPEDYWGNVNPIGPRSMYDEAKRFAEAACAAYARSRGVDVRIARIFNTYGPRMQLTDGRAIPNFMVSAIRGEPLTIYGDGSQTRSFCYIDDLAEGLFRLLTVEHSMLRKLGELPVINLGNPEEVTILALAQEVLQVTASNSEIALKELPGDDPKVRQPDIGRAREILKWVPGVSRREGLRRSLPYFVSEVSRSWRSNNLQTGRR